LQAAFSSAILILLTFVAKRSSPTNSILQVLLNAVHASQSSCANGSSSRTIGYFSMSSLYKSDIAGFDIGCGSFHLKPRSYLSSLKNSWEAGSIPNLTFPSWPARFMASVSKSRASCGWEIGGAKPPSSPIPIAKLYQESQGSSITYFGLLSYVEWHATYLTSRISPQ
jgi:hypothetical protein